MRGFCAALFALVAGCRFALPDVGDAPPDTTSDGSGAVAYKQVEHLGRPAINEVLLLTNDLLNNYNASAPSFKAIDQTTFNRMVAEAKSMLKVFYLSACLLNGELGLSSSTGIKPAGIQCHAVGPAIWVGGQLNSTVLTPESKAASQAYADKVFDQFVPDVLRIDMSLATSTYLSLCEDLHSKPLLCGGRFVNNDVIDVTYNYLFAGATILKGNFDQLRALVSDGVNFSLNDTQNVGNAVIPVAGNANQGHTNISTVFPYAAPPL